MALSGEFQGVGDAFHAYSHPPSRVYLTHTKGPLITRFGLLRPQLELRNNPKYSQHSYTLPSIVLDDKNHVVAALIHTYTHPSAYIYLTHPNGP